MVLFLSPRGPPGPPGPPLAPSGSFTCFSADVLLARGRSPLRSGARTTLAQARSTDSPPIAGSATVFFPGDVE
jgi:hypothetical protein